MSLALYSSLVTTVETRHGRQKAKSLLFWVIVCWVLRQFHGFYVQVESFSFPFSTPHLVPRDVFPRPNTHRNLQAVIL